jgi:PPK2 family polyphosphate:nucleotide phosphotransferase
VSDVRAHFRLPVGVPVDLDTHGCRATPVGPRHKKAGRRALAALGPHLVDRQQALWAEGRAGGSRRVLVVLQGMDTAGKGGVVRAVGGLLEPQGVALSSFGRPTAEELDHDVLWRVRRALPAPGVVGFFDRSHYEDVLVARVEQLAEPAELERRIHAINAFETELVDSGVAVVKVFLHLSSGAQLDRLTARLDDPDKHWKYTPEDRLNRSRWDDYQRVYADVLQRCATASAPWLLVPADRKWYARWAVGAVLSETLDELDPQFPPPTYDVVGERAALLATRP